MGMKKVITVGVGEFSLKTGYDIYNTTNDLCRKHKVKCDLKDLAPMWGYKYYAILDGTEEDINLIIKVLRTAFTVKVK
ncbi:hypothetical protein D3C76_01460 [compost metagenome]